MDVHGESSAMGPYVFCAVGAILGWIASRMTQPQGFVPLVEAIAVGIFGAFAGGEFLPAVVAAAPAPGQGLTGLAVAMAVVGSFVGLILLGVMRKAVGPMKPHKNKRKAT